MIIIKWNSWVRIKNSLTNLIKDLKKQHGKAKFMSRTLSFASLSAPASKRKRRQSVWPQPAAQNSGVYPACGSRGWRTHALPSQYPRRRAWNTWKIIKMRQAIQKTWWISKETRIEMFTYLEWRTHIQIIMFAMVLSLSSYWIFNMRLWLLLMIKITHAVRGFLVGSELHKQPHALNMTRGRSQIQCSMPDLIHV